MKRINKILQLFMALVSVTFVSGFVGCAQDENGFFIQQNQVPTDTCEITTDEKIYRSEGRLDVAAGKGYYIYPLLRNYYVSTSAKDGQPEKNNIHLRRYQVELDLSQLAGQYDPQAAAPYVNFTTFTSGMVQPSGGSTASRIKAISDELVKILKIPEGVKPIVFVKLRAYGTRSDEEVESGEFVYPVTLCNKCFVTMLSAPPAADQPITSNPCGLPQDGYTTCWPFNSDIICASSSK